MITSIRSVLSQVFLTLVLGTSPAFSADPLQTQMRMTGDVEVDLVRAAIDDGVLTAIFAYRNNGTEEAGIKYKVSEVFYLDKSEGKKYHVLADSQGDWIAAPVARGSIAVETGMSAQSVPIPPGGKKLVWFKFPAPPKTSMEIDIILPDALPFEKITLNP